jgi:hypothetical protein
VDAGIDLAGGIESIRSEAARLGRSMEKFDLSVITANEPAGAGGLESRIRELLKLGFHRVLFLIDTKPADSQWPALEKYAALIRQFR